MSNYGNSFGYKVTDVTGVERINVWDRTDEIGRASCRERV